MAEKRQAYWAIPMNVPAPRFSPVRQFLRDATHQDHVRLNRHPLLVGITKADYSLATYHRVLKTYFRFYEQIEYAFTQYLSVFPVYTDADHKPFDYQPRLKLPWLRQDLHHARIEPASIPAANASVDITSTAELVGILYTIEGSSLGGEVISQHISRNLGLTPDAGGRFFYGYGKQILPMWREFESFMDFALTSPSEMEAAGLAARKTFNRMEKMLDGA